MTGEKQGLSLHLCALILEELGSVPNSDPGQLVNPCTGTGSKTKSLITAVKQRLFVMSGGVSKIAKNPTWCFRISPIGELRFQSETIPFYWLDSMHTFYDKIDAATLMLEPSH